jgi:Ca2+-binding RTX toxin-like protein
MHMATGDDVINGFGGNDTVYGASGGDDALDGGTHTASIGDTLSYIEHTGPISVSVIVDQSGVPQMAAHFLARAWANGTDEFVNFERIILTNFNDLFLSESTTDAVQMQGIKIEVRDGDEIIHSGNGDDKIFGGLGAHAVYGRGGMTGLSSTPPTRSSSVARVATLQR